MERGCGFWKFTYNLLHHPDYVKNIRDLIQNLRADTFHILDKRKLENTLLNIQNDLHEKMFEAKMDENNSLKEELE